MNRIPQFQQVYGAEGKGVKAHQFTLNNCYITEAEDKLNVDGKYGKLTKAAVRVA